MPFDNETVDRELARTSPDFVLFIPKAVGYEDDNVHLHVVRHEKSSQLVAVWTQSSYDGHNDNHAVIATSRDEGKTWCEPRFLFGARPGHGIADKQASWAVPVISRSGRIYVFFNRETDFIDFGRNLSGVLACSYSDDVGVTWSDPVDLRLRDTPYDYAGESNPSHTQNNVIFQCPRRMKALGGRYLFSYGKYTSRKVKPAPEKWYKEDSHLFFMVAENLDDDPEPGDLVFTHLPDDDRGIGVPLERDGKDRSVAQEPCPVELPDGRLFCSLRTARGFAAYTVSEDGGHTWTEPEPIRFSDGTVFVHPLSPCPIYELGEGNGRFALLFHGHAEDIGNSRNPVLRARGVYDPTGEQPIRFDRTDCDTFMALPPDAYIEGHPMNQLSMYASTAEIGGRTVLWYPERKCFLLGKYLG